ncbi:MAG: hypothetical protein E7342_01635 [Clostridiales bacterium]|nr:hypothetical protein [Clostridiales bacterium]
MKVKLIKTNTYFNAIIKVAKELKTASREIDDKNLIFTEEKMTLLTERQIVSTLGGTFNTEVFSFIKYLKKHKSVDNLLKKEGSIMLLRKIIAEKKAETILFKRGLGYQYAPSVFEQLAQLKSAKVTPFDLEEALKDLDGTLYNKISDLAFMYKEYEKLLEEKGFIDQNNYLNELPGLIESQDLSNVNVFLVGFNSFTKQGKEVVKTLLKKAKSVTAILVSGENHYLYTNETTNAFLSIASNEKIKVEIEDFSPINKESEFLLKNLFNPKVFKKDFNKLETTAISLYEGENIEDELERCAHIIKTKVMGGNRYRDFAIGLENDLYKEKLSKIFGRYDIPFFLDVRKNLSEHPIYSLLTSYFKNLKGALSIKDLMSFAKNPLVCTDKDFLDDFENYLYKYNIQRYNLSKEFTHKTDKIVEFEDFRKKLIDCFSKVKEEDFAENYVKEIKKLLIKIKAEEKIEFLTNQLKNQGELVESSYNERALVSVLEVLEEVLKILKGTKISFTEFSLILISGVKAKEIPIIPQFNDAVFVGTLKQCGLAPAENLFVVGLTSELPGVKEDVSLLSDSDLRELDKISVFVEPTIKIVNSRLREDLSLGLVGFNKNLYLSYPTTIQGKQKKRSEVITYIQKLFNKNGKDLPVIKKGESFNYDQEFLVENRFLSKKQGDKAFALITAEAKEGKTKDLESAISYYHAVKEIKLESLDDFLKELNEEKKVSLKEKVNLKEDRISATVLERYYNCPYSSFLTSLLLLKEREVGEVQAFDIGNYIHEILEKYTENIESIKTKEESDKKVEEIITKVEEKYAHFLDDAISSVIIERARKEAKRECYAVLEELKTSSFKITGREKEFGKGEDKIILDTKNGNIFVTGKIDRVDETEKFVRIIDYKTGSQKDSNKDLYMGKKVQLYLYMNALLKNSKDKSPAGVYYLTLADDFKNLDEEPQTFFDGRSLRDEEALKEIDKSLDKGVKSSKIKASFDKDGKVVKPRGKDNSLLDKEVFDDYLKYSLLISKKGAEGITDGVIIASPTKGACDYCKYKGLCSFDEKYDQKRDVEVSNDTISKAVKEEEN